MCCSRNSGVAVGEQRAADRAERHAAGDAEVGRHVAGGLLAEGPLVGGGEAAPAVLGGVRDAGVAGVEQLALQGPRRRRSPRRCGRRRIAPGRRRPAPGSRLASIQARGLVDGTGRSMSIVVVCRSCPRPLSDPGQLADVLAVPGGVAEQLGVGGDAPQVQVLVVLPRVADAAVDLEAGLHQVDRRRRRRTPWPCSPPAGP